MAEDSQQGSQGDCSTLHILGPATANDRSRQLLDMTDGHLASWWTTIGDDFMMAWQQHNAAGRTDNNVICCDNDHQLKMDLLGCT